MQLDTTTVLSGSIDSLANSIGTTQDALNSVTALVKQDLPKTIEAARTALASAQATARVVDNFLSGISRIQFLNINYNPDVPLDSSIGQISDSLSGLPPQLTSWVMIWAPSTRTCRPSPARFVAWAPP